MDGKNRLFRIVIIIFFLIFLKLWPCQVESGGGFLLPGTQPPPPNFHWHIHSLYTVAEKGFEWSPLIFDAYIIHRSNPIFILLYPVYFIIGYAALSRISNKEIKFKQFLKFTRLRLIIFVLGVLSVFPIIVSFLSGQVGGIMNFTPNQKTIYDILKGFLWLLLPLSLFSLYGLYRFNVIFLFFFFHLFEPNPISRFWGFARWPHDLSYEIFLVILPLFVIEWFIISFLIVESLEKVKQKRAARGKN